jgi:hemerythrin-like domain-containing protein
MACTSLSARRNSLTSYTRPQGRRLIEVKGPSMVECMHLAHVQEEGDIVPQVVDLIRNEHASIGRMLTMLEQQIDLFEAGASLDYELIKEVLDYFVTFADLCHHPKESMVLAKLRQRAPDMAREVGDLEGEHDRISKELHDFTHAVMNVLLDVEVPRDTFVRLARAFIANERKHMAEEEERFLPLAEAGLGPQDWAEIADRTEKFNDPLGTHAAGLDFAHLRAKRGPA